MRNSNVPSLADLQAFDVNRRGEFEGIRQSTYSFLTYPDTGQVLFTFFQNPVGSGGTTLTTTNLRAAGQFPQPQSFLVESIEVHLYLNTAIGQTANAATATTFADNVYDVYKQGSVEFFIGSKNYLEEAPVMVFPPKTKLKVDNALSIDSNAAINQITSEFAAPVGRPYYLDPPVLLVPNQNFDVKIRYDTAVPIAVAGRIGVKLDGILYRQSQ